jgi:hypothetical protein
MISILDRQSRPTPPPWMEGARDLASVVCHHGIIWSCAEPALITGDGPWSDLADGYAIGGKAEEADLDALTRAATCYTTADVVDLRGWIWQAPLVINEAGERQFAVGYGDDWLPVLTTEQEKAVQMATEARLAFGQQLVGAGEGVNMRAGCAWTAHFLCLIYHLTPQILAKLRLIDDALVLQTLACAADLPKLKTS